MDILFHQSNHLTTVDDLRQKLIGHEIVHLLPAFLTMAGFVLNLVAATLFGTDHLRLGGFVVLLAGVFDFLDGQGGSWRGSTTRTLSPCTTSGTRADSSIC